MEESSCSSEGSISMGAPSLMTASEGYNSFIPNELSFTFPVKGETHAMGELSISSINHPEDCNSPFSLSTVHSPKGPDVLMSTHIDTKPCESDSNHELSDTDIPLPNYEDNRKPPDDELTISIGSLSQYERNKLTSAECYNSKTSLANKIEQIEIKSKISKCGDVSTQTEKLNCKKCEELDILHNKRVTEMANEIQRQYSSHFQMTEQQNAAAENAQKQIVDLKNQIEVADKHLKANRAFLDQQAAEREQEREEAQLTQNQLKSALNEKEKEFEKEKNNCIQLISDFTKLQETSKAKDAKIDCIEKEISVLHNMEKQFNLLKVHQSEVYDENVDLQTVLEVKDQLLKAQADQIAALQIELEKQLDQSDVVHSESEKSDLVVDRNELVVQTSLNSSIVGPSIDAPTLFEELQQLIVRLLHKVDRSTRALEAAQWSKQKTAVMISPRSLNTPSTSTEDISIKDRFRQSWLDDLRESSPSPPGVKGQCDPELALSFLQQLDGRLVALNRVEEGVCKKIADLETELRRTVQSEKQSLTKVADLEQQKKQQQQLINDTENEKKELQTQHTELLKRISSLENRLEEQRRSAAVGASQNVHAEKLRVLSEENHQLVLVIKGREEAIDSMKEEIGELQQRISKLMKNIHEKEQENNRKLHDFSNHERLRDAPPNDPSFNWTKFQSVQNSPEALSPINPPNQIKEMPESILFEVTELKSKLLKSEQRCESLQDELTCNTNRLTQLESIEHNENLDKITKDKEQLISRCHLLEKDLDISNQQLKEFENLKLNHETLEREFDLNVQKLTQLHNQLSNYEKLGKDQLSSQQLSHRKLVDILNAEIIEQRKVGEKEKEDLVRLIETLRARCTTLEAEIAEQRSTIDASKFLQKRIVSLKRDAIQYQQNLESLKSMVFAKEKIINELDVRLKYTSESKMKLGKTVNELQQQIATLQQHKKTVNFKDKTYQEGHRAPPDLLAPSFVEVLGSALSSRCSSRNSMSERHSSYSPLLRTVETTLNDYSLPESMIGKQVLKEVQKESELILALLQKKELAREKANPEKNCDELDYTLTPDLIVQIEATSYKDSLKTLKEKNDLLKYELELERMTGETARNSLKSEITKQQKQIWELQKPKTIDNRCTSPANSYSERIPKTEVVYRILKLESVKKNLVGQKKFLTALINEYDPPTKRTRVSNKSCNRFRIAALVVISIGRMRFVLQQWRHRRKMIQNPPASD